MAEHKKSGLTEAAAGAAIAGYAPNAVYHAENRHLKRKVAGVQHQIDLNNAAKPRKPEGVRGPDGNVRGAPKEAKAQYVKDLKSHQKTHQALVESKKLIKPKIYPKQTKLWLGSAAVGIPLVAHGMHRAFPKDKMEKKFTQRDADAATVGGVAGYGIYQGGAIVGSKPYEKKTARKIQANPEYKAKLEDHKEKALGDKRAKIETGDKSLRGKYFHKYPTDIPGGKFKRAVSWSHTGPTGVLATTGAIGLAGAAAVHHDRKKRHIVKRNMSDSEIRHRKKVQGISTRTTSTLGLTSLGLMGASVAAKKPGNPLYRNLQKVPSLRKIDTPAKMGEKLKNTAVNTGIVSSGIGGASGFNFAAYTAAEAKKKKKQPMVKRDEMAPVYGEVAKAWSPVVDKPFDSEANRHKRSRAYELGAGAVGGAAVGAGALKAGEGVAREIKARKNPPRPAGAPHGPLTKPQATWARGKVTSGVKAARVKTKAGAGIAAAGAGALAVSGHIGRKRKGDWESYSKSAFGITHD